MNGNRTIGLASLFLIVAVALAASSKGGIVAYYPFNGAANEVTGHNIDLTLMGDATFAASMNPGLGQALSLDGDGDGAIGTDFVKIAGNDMTGMAWVYANSLDGTWDTIIKNWGHANGGQFHFGLGSGGAEDKLQNYIGDPISSNVVAPDSLPLGEWIHTAFVVDSAANEQRLYINGLLVATGGYTGTLTQIGVTGLGIGHKPTDTGDDLAISAPGPWNGLIDEVALFDEALSSAQIGQIYRAGLAGYALSTTIPEPTTIGLLLFGVMGIGLWRRRHVATGAAGQKRNAQEVHLPS